MYSYLENTHLVSRSRSMLDRILPITAAGLRTASVIKGARLLVVKDGPHCIPWTHAEEVNAELLKLPGRKGWQFADRGCLSTQL